MAPPVEQLVEEAMHRPLLELVVLLLEEAMEPVVVEDMEVDTVLVEQVDTEEVVTVQEDMEEELVVVGEVVVVMDLQKRSPLKRTSTSTSTITMDGDKNDMIVISYNNHT